MNKARDMIVRISTLTVPISWDLMTIIFAELELIQVLGTTNRILCDAGCTVYTVGIDNSNLKRLIANGMV